MTERRRQPERPRHDRRNAVRKDSAIVDSLEWEAWRNGRKLSDEVRLALREHLRREEQSA
jgi:hypothetical protein